MECSVSNAVIAFKSESIRFEGGSPCVELLQGGKSLKLIPVGAGVESDTEVSTPMGPAHARAWAWHDPRGFSFTWTISRLTQWPGFTMKMTFTNESKEAIRLKRLVLCRSGVGAFHVDGNPGQWFLSTLDSHDSSAGGFNPSGDLATDAHRKFLDIVTLFTERGARGLVMGAVGPAVSDVRYHCDVNGGKMSLEIDSEMDDVLVDPGESRESEEVLLLAAPYETALTNLFRWMAVTHGARIARGPVFGWCSWYSRTFNIKETDVEGLLNAVVTNRERLPMQVIQIDDGWEKAYGDWTPVPKKFPNGMKPIADKITAAGMIPGIWLCPVRTSTNGMHFQGDASEWLDSTDPDVRTFIRKILGDRYRDGYRYFKLDFDWPRMKDRHDQKMTHLQVERDLFKQYREAIGEDSYLSACVGGLNRGAIGYSDSLRIATDACVRWRGMYVGPGIPDTINGVGSMALTQGILFAVDPDCTYTDPENYIPAKHKVPPLMPDALRAWHAYVGLLGGCMMTSDLLQSPPWNSPATIRMMEIINPPATDKGRAFDGQTDPWHRQFGFAAQRPWGNFVSALVFNPAEQSTNAPVKGMPLATLGSRFHVWSFWDESYLGIQDSEFVATNVPPHGAVVLRLTAMSANEDEPVLVGSNLHIGMGSAEIKTINTQSDKMEIALTDAGARAGDLFVYSRRPLAFGSATGCAVTAVDRVGENIWSVQIKDRSRNKPQQISLSLGK